MTCVEENGIEVPLTASDIEVSNSAQIKEVILTNVSNNNMEYTFKVKAGIGPADGDITLKANSMIDEQGNSNLSVTSGNIGLYNYIYNEGTLYVNISGGTYNTDNIYFEARGNGATCGKAGVLTSNTVDLTNVDTIYFDIAYKTRPGSSNAFIAIGINCSTDITRNLWSKTYWVVRNEFTAVFLRRIKTVDVSQKTGSYYVALVSHYQHQIVMQLVFLQVIYIIFIINN